jgi:hypothetical protein
MKGRKEGAVVDVIATVISNCNLNQNRRKEPL